MGPHYTESLGQPTNRYDDNIVLTIIFVIVLCLLASVYGYLIILSNNACGDSYNDLFDRLLAGGISYRDLTVS